MIRIHKPSTAPDVLRTRGVAERRGNSRLYNRFAHEFQQGQRHFDFDSNIYGHPSVKEALSLAQHGKCCYCESKILHIDYGDVEHFRPKAAYCQDNASSLQRPGYYWLAYDWHNLYLSCTLCNQKHKRNFFPLHDPVHRAHSHRHDLRAEHPLFIDPGKTDPKTFIDFHGEIAFPLHGQPEGSATIEGMGLNRHPLQENRREHLRELKILHQLSQFPDVGDPNFAILQEQAKHTLAAAIAPDAEYAATALAAIASEFAFVL